MLFALIWLKKKHKKITTRPETAKELLRNKLLKPAFARKTVHSINFFYLQFHLNRTHVGAWWRKRNLFPFPASFCSILSQYTHINIRFEIWSRDFIRRDIQGRYFSRYVLNEGWFILIQINATEKPFIQIIFRDNLVYRPSLK